MGTPSANHIIKHLPLVKGSLGMTMVRCGNARCKCAWGELHSAWYLSYRVEGKTHTVHVPKPAVKEIQRLCENWKRLKGLLETETHRHLQEVLKRYPRKGRKKS